MLKRFFILALTLIIMTTGLCFAAGGTGSTANGNNLTNSSTVGKNYWRRMATTGTRYSIRVQSDDGTFWDIGGTDNYDQYYILHTRNELHDSDGQYAHVNPTEKQEKNGQRKEEAIFMGTSYTGYTQMWSPSKNKYYFFDTPASSLDSYIKELNGVKQYRHVINWVRARDDGKIITTESSKDKTYAFGLNGDDIEKLVNLVETRATQLNDTATLQDVANIKNGTLNYQIRFEIVYAMKCPAKSTLRNHRLNLSTQYTSADAAQLITYREALAIESQIDRDGGAIYNTFTSIAGLLWEEHDTPYPYMTEYKNSYKIISGAGSYTNLGWDYLDIENDNPYINRIMYKEIGTGIDLATPISGPASNEKLTYSKRDFDGFEYVGVQITKPEEGNIEYKSDIVLDGSKGSCEVIFWYKRNSTPIKVMYKDVDTKKEIVPSENINFVATTQNATKKISYKEIEKYVYQGMEIVKPTATSSSMLYEIEIPDDRLNHEIVFWYKQATIVTVTHKDYNTGEVLKGPTTTNIIVKTSFAKETIKDYTYYRYQKLKPTAGKLTTGNSVSIAHDKQEHEIVFYYTKNFTPIKVMYKDIETGVELKEAIVENFTATKKVKTKTYSADTFEFYEYAGVQEIKPVEGIINSSKTEVEVSDDRVAHEIVFWYRPLERGTFVNVSYVSKNTGKLLVSPQQYKVPENSSMTFSNQDIKLYGINTYEFVEVVVNNGTPTQDKTVNIINNGTDIIHTIEFRYIQKVKVKVIGVDIESKRVIKTFINEEMLEIPASKVYNSKDFNVVGFTSTNDLFQKEGSVSYLSEAPNGKNTATVSIQESENSTTKPISQILIAFFYKSDYKITVKHIYENPITKQQQVKYEQNNIAFILGDTFETSSRQYPNYINLKVTINGSEITPNGFQKYGVGVYDVEFTTEAKNYEIVFYYTSQIINIKHEWVNGTPIQENPPKILDPNYGEKPLSTHPYKDYKLNNEKGTTTPVYIPVIPGKLEQELVFTYGTPDLIFGPGSPVNQLNTGVVLYDLNNQYVNQQDNSYYWVLDEKGGLTYRFAITHIDTGKVECIAHAYIPFDVYINNAIVKSNTPIKLTFSKVSDNDNGYDVYQGKLENIYVPLWVNEGSHTIKVTVSSTYTSDANLTDTKTNTAEASVQVIGKIYDFSVTNIQGDDIWKTSIFTTYKTDNGEHEADTLPIGQNDTQNPKYLYGIKQGSKFFFSLNTKGSDSNGIKIVPKFYYIDKDGNWKGEVKAYSNNKEISQISLTRTASVKDTYRVTQEYTSELLTARSLYNTVSYDKANIGNYAKVELGVGTRTPYLAYWNRTDADSLTAKLGKTEAQAIADSGKAKADLYKEASHWYGDYMLPNNTVYYQGSTKMSQDGFVVVYFMITSTKDGNEYLAYNLPSGGIESASALTQWKVEQNGNNSYLLPKTISNKTGKEINSWLQDEDSKYGYAPVIIYQISQSTSQNYDTIGTH